MKYLITYNESLRDKMTPKSKADIDELIKGSTQDGLNLQLVDALAKRDIEMIKILLDYGADVHMRDNWPMKYMTAHNEFEIIDLLKIYESLRDKMTPKSDLELKEIIKKIPPSQRLSKGAELGILRLVRDEIENKNIPLSEINDALMTSAMFGHIDIVKYLLDRGADIHHKNDAPLRWACREGFYDVVEFLLEKGADVSQKEYQALDWALHHDHNEIVDLLQEYIADRFNKKRKI